MERGIWSASSINPHGSASGEERPNPGYAGRALPGEEPPGSHGRPQLPLQTPNALTV